MDHLLAAELRTAVGSAPDQHRVSPDYREVMASGDGNGWVRCRCGEQHWGRHGAAGLLLLRFAEEPTDSAEGADRAGPDVLLQLRAAWTHEGGRWGLPGGARDSHEDAPQAALREAAEEADISASDVQVLGTIPGVDHGDWQYTYVLARVVGPIRPRVLTAESDDLRWVPIDEVPTLALHRGLDQTWSQLATGVNGLLSR